VGLLLPIRI
uniref:Uncharacterized protein n=1 Tax=Solanum lycopersicum TaxID=4081 RepID=A0A3Q7G043_SOLLC